MGSDEHRQQWESAGGKTPDYWEFCKIEDLLENSKSIAVGVMYPGGNTLGGIPLVKVTDVKNGEIQSKPVFCISSKVDEEYKRTRLNGTELLITLVGNPGDCVVVSKSMAGWNVARALAVVRLADINLRQWIRHVLLSAPAKHLIDVRLNTTVQKTLNLKDIRSLGIPIPPKNERDAISSIIGSLDDKIELNRRMNATLEGLAQALFQSWFVDFDPVLDNALAAGNPIPDELTDRAAVRRQALDNGTANREAAQHFPATFQLTEELGWIPEGWDVISIENVAEKIGMGPFGSRITRDNFIEKGVPVIRGNNLTNDFVDRDFVYLSEEKATELKSSNVFPRDIVFTHRGTIGQVGIIPLNSKYPRYVVSQSQMFLRINQEITSPEYAFRYFKSGSGMERLLGFTSQVGVPAIARPTTSLKSLPIPIPAKSVVTEYDRINSQYDKKVIANTIQSDALTKLRDTLLPQLISGELTIPVAQAQSEEFTHG